MTKDELVHELSGRTGLDCKECMAAVDGASEIIRDELSRHNEVVIRGFGAFCVKERKAKPGRDINKGKQIIIPACNQVKFKAYKELKESVK